MLLCFSRKAPSAQAFGPVAGVVLTLAITGIPRLFAIPAACNINPLHAVHFRPRTVESLVILGAFFRVAGADTLRGPVMTGEGQSLLRNWVVFRRNYLGHELWLAHLDA